MNNQTIDKYLRSHAEPEAAAVTLQSVTGMRNVLAVPAYDEPPDRFVLLESLPVDGHVLCIILVNEREDSSPEVRRHNLDFVRHLQARYGPGIRVGPGATEHPTPFGGLLLLRRTGDTLPLPTKQGVGLARKIVCDVALSLCRRGQVLADVIHCTDADAHLPPDYFQRVKGYIGALFSAVFPFTHVGEPGNLHRAGQHYEVSLRYYVLGLQQAGSPYAMHTIGSTIAVSTAAYAAVRGFPLRHGAEDFYLLNKLAKVGPVKRLGGAPIALQDRVSDRIPFGTGPAVRRILGGEPKKLYHPRTFAVLGDFLRGLSRIVGSKEPLVDTAALADALCPGLAHELGIGMVQGSGIEGALTAAFTRGTDVSARLRHVHTYFDAFRTLKWVHALRAAGFAEMPAGLAVAELLGREPGPPDGLLSQLERRESHECRGNVGLGPGSSPGGS